jgi:hypothetical protein
MHKVNKNDKAFKELDAYAKAHKKDLKEVLLSEEHAPKIAEIFYKHMPALVKFTMKKEKFEEFYKANKETFVKQLKLA